MMSSSLFSYSRISCAFFFFFQAEDGIRDKLVTGVQTCALPIWSFVVMRALFLLLEMPVLLGFARLVFGVRIVGSIALLLGVSLIGALAFAGIGLLVAARAQNTQTVTGLINLVMLPMFVASGVFFSTARFPDAVQPFLRVLPLTALNDGLRAVMIEGAGVTEIAGQIALLGVTTAATFFAALRLFRWR